MDDDMNSASTFWRSCDPTGQYCHCDWRLTLESCAETRLVGTIFKIQAVWAAIVAVLAAMLFAHRVCRQGQRLFDTRRGYLRPQPVETLLVFAFIFNIIRMIHSVVIVNNSAENYVFRSFLFEFPWQFGFGAFAAYLWGIATTVFDSETVMDGGWRLSQADISKIGLAFVLSPMITNNICSVASGVYAQRGDAYRADIFARLLYAFWTFYCLTLAICVLYAGIRLMRLLDLHLQMLGSGKRYELVKTGRMKVRMIMTVTGACLSCFVLILFPYAVCRNLIQNSTPANVLWAILWNYAGPMASILIEIALFIDPRMFGGPSFSVNGSSSERKNEPPGFASSINTDRHQSNIPLSWVKLQDAEEKRTSARSSNVYTNSAISDSTLLIHQAP